MGEIRDIVGPARKIASDWTKLFRTRHSHQSNTKSRANENSVQVLHNSKLGTGVSYISSRGHLR